MRIKYCVSAALFLMFATTTVHAELTIGAESPYRLIIKPTQIPQPTIPPSSNLQPTCPAYPLEYKDRERNKPPMSMRVGIPVASNIDKPSQAMLAKLPINQMVLGDFSADTTMNEKLAHQPFSKEIALAAYAVSLDPALVHAVIYVESRYRRRAISPKGAVGLMQILPDTAARYGISDAGNSPSSNLKAGTLYLRDLMCMFDNRLDLVLAAYNAGEGAVLRHSRQVPPYRETKQYVLAVVAKYNEWHNVEATNLIAKDVDAGAVPIKPVRPFKAEYLAGTRLAQSNEAFLPNH